MGLMGLTHATPKAPCLHLSLGEGRVPPRQVARSLQGCKSLLFYDNDKAITYFHHMLSSVSSS